jgi:hypothetical protein
MVVGHSRPNEKGCRDAVSEGNHVHVQRNQEQSAEESWLCPVDSVAVINSEEVEFL